MNDYKKQKDAAEKLARGVEDEIIKYLHINEKPEIRLRTNAELAKEYAGMIGKNSVTKPYVSRILKKYVPAKMLRFREEELKYQSQHIVRFKTPEENSANGKKGAGITNTIKKIKKGLTELLLAKEGHREITFSKL